MRIPWAVWLPEHGVDDGPRATAWRAMLLHTPVSKATDLHLPDPARPGVGVHGYILADGVLHQYLDTDRMTGHAFAANPWTTAWEVWDNADPEHTPFNAAQLATIDRLARTLAVPGLVLREQPSHGIGWHRQYPSWNLNGHSCPTDMRQAQITNVIIPALAGGGGVDDLTPEQDATLKQAAADAKAARAQIEDLHNRLDGLLNGIKAGVTDGPSPFVRGGTGLGKLAQDRLDQ